MLFVTSFYGTKSYNVDAQGFHESKANILTPQLGFWIVIFSSWAGNGFKNLSFTNLMVWNLESLKMDVNFPRQNGFAFFLVNYNWCS